MLNKERSKSAAKLVRPYPLECWQNSIKATTMLSALYLDHTFVYVEGYYLQAVTGEAIEHGWVLDTTTDEIIDVTNYHNAVAYYEAERFSLQAIIEAHRLGLSIPLTTEDRLYSAMLDLIRDKMKGIK